MYPPYIYPPYMLGFSYPLSYIQTTGSDKTMQGIIYTRVVAHVSGTASAGSVKCPQPVMTAKPVC